MKKEEMLLVNSLITWQSEEQIKCTERILWANNIVDIVYVIDVNKDNLPVVRAYSEIEENINNGFIGIEDIDNYMTIISEGSIKEKDRQQRDRAWEIIKEIILIEPDIFDKIKRRELINRVAKEKNIHVNTVVKYIKKYWKRGMTQNALLPDYYKCGGKGKEKSIGDIKRGRKRRNDILGEGLNVDEEIKKIFKISLNKYYYNSSKKSLKTTYECMIKDYFSNRYISEEREEKLQVKSLNEIPTLGQFTYWFNKDRNLKKEMSIRISNKKYEQVGRGIIGTSTKEAQGPNFLAQIDASILNVYICSSFNRNLIIGKPVIYTVMDVYSRAILGINITLEGPSWIGSMGALANCATDKVEFCNKFGVNIKEGQWPMRYLPDTILADRGEMASKKVDNLILGLGVKIKNTQPYRAELKGIIEKQFDVIDNEIIKPFLPGVVDLSTKERGDKDYRVNGRLNLSEITQILIRYVLYYNNNHILKSYDKDEMMIEDDILCVPSIIWKWGIENRAGKLRYIEEDIVKLNLMPEEYATITAKGIRFKNILYTCNAALKEKWFEKARIKGNWKIRIAYDPRCMNYLYIKEENSRGFEKCYLLDHQLKYKDKSIEEINFLFQYQNLQKQKEDSNELEAKINLINDVENIVKKATFDSKMTEDTGLSDSSKIKNIKNNRAIEKLVNRNVDKFELGMIDNTEPAKIIEIHDYNQEKSSESDDIHMLRKKQRERLDERIKKDSNS